MSLAEELSSVKPGTKGADKKIMAIGNRYPAWKLSLNDLTGDDWKGAQEHLYKWFQQGSKLLDDIGSVRVTMM